MNWEASGAVGEVVGGSHCFKRYRQTVSPGFVSVIEELLEDSENDSSS